MKQLIQRLIKKLKVVFGGRYIHENIHIEVKNTGNSEVQIVLKLKTVFGGKGQIQTSIDIQTEIQEEPKPKKCSILNYDLRRLIH